MSKKQKSVQAQVEKTENEKQDQISQGVIAKQDSKDKKQDKAGQKDKKQDKKKKDKKEKTGGVVKKTKETMSELKKVTWPTFGEVVKKTGIVIAFVIIFGLFIFGVNTLLGWLVGLLVGA